MCDVQCTCRQQLTAPLYMFFPLLSEFQTFTHHSSPNHKPSQPSMIMMIPFIAKAEKGGPAWPSGRCTSHVPVPATHTSGPTYGSVLRTVRGAGAHTRPAASCTWGLGNAVAPRSEGRHQGRRPTRPCRRRRPALGQACRRSNALVRRAPPRS